MFHWQYSFRAVVIKLNVISNVEILTLNKISTIVMPSESQARLDILQRSLYTYLVAKYKIAHDFG